MSHTVPWWLPPDWKPGDPKKAIISPALTDRMHKVSAPDIAHLMQVWELTGKHAIEIAPTVWVYDLGLYLSGWINPSDLHQLRRELQLMVLEQEYSERQTEEA